MAFSGCVLSEEQFQCPICLDVFTSQVSTPCGHSFCLTCIGEYWSQARGGYRCPLCGLSFRTWPELYRDRTLEVGLAPEEPVAREGEVVCDVCDRGRSLRAVMSCLECLESYCRGHLEPHYLSRTLQGHRLLAVGKNLQTSDCGLHGRPLDHYCRTDRTCICTLCTRSHHCGHRVVPLVTEARKKKIQLKKTCAEIQQMMQDRLKKVEEIRQCVELSRSSTQREIEDSVQVFEMRQAKLTEEMEEKQREVERHAEGLIKELEQELTELQKRNTELEQLSHTENHLHFLQSLPSLCKPPPTKDWSDIIRKLLQEIQEVFPDRK